MINVLKSFTRRSEPWSSTKFGNLKTEKQKRRNLKEMDGAVLSRTWETVAISPENEAEK